MSDTFGARFSMDGLQQLADIHSSIYQLNDELQSLSKKRDLHLPNALTSKQRQQHCCTLQHISISELHCATSIIEGSVAVLGPKASAELLAHVNKAIQSCEDTRVSMLDYEKTMDQLEQLDKTRVDLLSHISKCLQSKTDILFHELRSKVIELDNYADTANKLNELISSPKFLVEPKVAQEQSVTWLKLLRQPENIQAGDSANTVATRFIGHYRTRSKAEEVTANKVVTKTSEMQGSSQRAKIVFHPLTISYLKAAPGIMKDGFSSIKKVLADFSQHWAQWSQDLIGGLQKKAELYEAEQKRRVALVKREQRPRMSIRSLSSEVSSAFANANNTSESPVMEGSPVAFIPSRLQSQKSLLSTHNTSQDVQEIVTPLKKATSKVFNMAMKLSPLNGDAAVKEEPREQKTGSAEPEEANPVTQASAVEPTDDMIQVKATPPDVINESPAELNYVGESKVSLNGSEESSPFTSSIGGGKSVTPVATQPPKIVNSSETKMEETNSRESNEVTTSQGRKVINVRRPESSVVRPAAMVKPNSRSIQSADNAKRVKVPIPPPIQSIFECMQTPAFHAHSHLLVHRQTNEFHRINRKVENALKISKKLQNSSNHLQKRSSALAQQSQRGVKQEGKIQELEVVPQVSYCASKRANKSVRGQEQYDEWVEEFVLSK